MILLRGGGGVRIGLCKNFFSLASVFFFTIKVLQEIFFSNLLPSPPPPSKVKWSAPKHRNGGLLRSDCQDGASYVGFEQ